MKKWALIENKLTSLVVDQENQPTVFTEGDCVWIDITGKQVGPGFKYIDGEFFPPDPPPLIRTKLEIINLLGQDYNSIILASKTDVEVEVWLEKFRLRDTFDMSDLSVRSDIEFLVTKNLITQEKANSILN